MKKTASRSKGRPGFRPAPTCTLDVVKDRAAYERFRRMLYDLFALDRNLIEMLDAVAKHFGVSRPQHTIIMTISHLGMQGDVTVRAVADYMRIAGPFVVTQSRLLEAKGLLTKQAAHSDRRRTLLGLTPAGERYVEQSTRMIQELNNIVFGPLKPSSFCAVSDALHAFAASSEIALAKTKTLGLRPKINRARGR